MERVEFTLPRAENTARYLKKLIFIAHHVVSYFPLIFTTFSSFIKFSIFHIFCFQDRHPTYTTEMLSWWLGKEF